MSEKHCPNCGKKYETDFPTREAAVAAGGPDNVLVGTIGQLRRVHWWRQVAREHVSTIGRHELNSWAQQVARGALGRARTSREPVQAGSVGRSAPMKRRGDGGVRECSKEGSAVRNAVEECMREISRCISVGE